MNSIEKSVRLALGECGLVDYEETKLGWVAQKNNRLLLGSKFLHAFNYPLKDINSSNLKTRLRGASSAAVFRLFSQINGIRMFGNHFVIPGVRTEIVSSGSLDYFNVPIDIDVVSGITDAEFSPVRGGVIGTSFRGIGKQIKNLKDILTENGEIVSGFFEENSEIVEQFDEFPLWIYSRILGAGKAFDETAMDVERNYPDKFIILD